MIELPAKAARKAGFRGCASKLARAATLAAPRSAAAFSEYCSDRMAARDFDAIASRCAQVADDPRASDGLKEAATGWLVRSRIADDADAGMLARLRPAFREYAVRTAAAFGRRDDADALDDFARALEAGGVPRTGFPEWTAALSAVMAARDGRTEAPSSVRRSVTELPKLVVSGMYWSGSGALYAYFSEFSEIAPIPGELRLWKEGRACLLSLARAIERGEGAADILFAVLSVALAGIGPVERWRDALSSRLALAASRQDGSGAYAAACRGFVEDAALAAARGGPAGREEFERSAARFTDELVGFWKERSGRIALFDNVVHIGGIEAARLLGDATVLCSFRDPRSNFVARWNENPRFDRDVGHFIEYYRDTRDAFERTLRGDPSLAAKVVPVSFERFILSEGYRDGLAERLGLDTSARAGGTRFRPGTSRKNVFNFMDFSDTEAIRRIERELPGYCVDPASVLE